MTKKTSNSTTKSNMIKIEDLTPPSNMHKPPVHPDLPKPPFSMAVIGPSRSGKSNLIRNMFLRDDMMGKTFDPDNIFIFCQSIELNDDFKDFETNYKFDHWDEHMVNRIYKDAKDIIKRYGKARLPHILIIADDCFDDPNFTHSKILPLLFMRGRHLNISLVLSGQKFSSIPRGARLNITDLICFRPYSENEFDFILNESVARMNKRKAIQIMKEIYLEPYSFIYFDFLNKDSTRRVRVGFDKPLTLT
jgi:hypothetical protein